MSHFSASVTVTSQMASHSLSDLNLLSVALVALIEEAVNDF